MTNRMKKYLEYVRNCQAKNIKIISDYLTWEKDHYVGNLERQGMEINEKAFSMNLYDHIPPALR